MALDSMRLRRLEQGARPPSLQACALLRWDMACLPLPRIIVTLYHAVASRLVAACPRIPALLSASPKAADKA
jgi:hypothetical protein